MSSITTCMYMYTCEVNGMRQKSAPCAVYYMEGQSTLKGSNLFEYASLHYLLPNTCLPFDPYLISCKRRCRNRNLGNEAV